MPLKRLWKIACANKTNVMFHKEANSITDEKDSNIRIDSTPTYPSRVFEVLARYNIVRHLWRLRDQCCGFTIALWFRE